MSETRQLDVNIMGREFRVGCPADEEATLLQAVELLNEKMQEIRTTGKVAGLERVAILAGLDIAHEYLQIRAGAGNFDIGAIQRRIKNMNATIDALLEEQQDLP